MRISDWSSDVCSSDLQLIVQPLAGGQDGRIGIGSPDLSLRPFQRRAADLNRGCAAMIANRHIFVIGEQRIVGPKQPPNIFGVANAGVEIRSEEHTSELQSLMRTSYAVFCLKKKTN